MLCLTRPNEATLKISVLEMLRNNYNIYKTICRLKILSKTRSTGLEPLEPRFSRNFKNPTIIFIEKLNNEIILVHYET